MPLQQLEHATADHTTPDHADPDLAQRSRTDADVRRARRTRPEHAALMQEAGELVLICEKRVVTELGIELPQRRRCTRGLELAK